jgi:hypothetical protein
MSKSVAEIIRAKRKGEELKQSDNEEMGIYERLKAKKKNEEEIEAADEDLDIESHQEPLEEEREDKEEDGKKASAVDSILRKMRASRK